MPEQRLTGHQKLGFSLFAVIGLATFVLGVIQIRNAVEKPFVLNADITFRTQSEIERENLERTKSIDTDSDGMNDYDELYVFRTSPYLEDSDSDGLNDGAEIAANTDPNCPQGRECRMAKIGGAGSGSASGAGTGSGAAPSTGGTAPAPVAETPAADEGAYQAILTTFGDPAELTAAEVEVKIAAMSSADLRTFLVEMGIPDNVLQKADDATLKSMLSETMGELLGEL